MKLHAKHIVDMEIQQFFFEWKFSQKIMKLRDIEGTLNFDSENHTLDIQVIPRDKECANAVSKTTNLSGGERSYTTVAFLISLWSCVDHPFYFLDEYDVFTVRISTIQCQINKESVV